MAGVHEMVKHMLKILHQILQDFERVFEHFMVTGDYRVNVGCTSVFLKGSYEGIN